ncbi:helix-turn-helix transcriptional regulator [Nakamurella panacisegetis]|nr:YafY family protein [Nakamurella panacisegetis]
MLTTSARLLKLLSLLQTPRDWTGPELAQRLEVSGRTIRADINRLRTLGYPVDATRGAVGGYRLGAGAQLPPLLLDDEEAIAVTLGLRSATGSAIAGIQDASLRALAKVEQVLPSRLRRRIATLQAYTVPVPYYGTGPTVDPEVLVTITAACRDHEQLRFDYTDHDGTATRRRADPHRLVSWGRRWYLVAWDPDRSDWRTFRVDRICLKIPNGPRFVERDLPQPDIAAYVASRVSNTTWRRPAKITVHASAEVVRERINPFIGTVEPVDEHTCTLTTGVDDPAATAVHLGLLGHDFTVVEPPELVEQVRQLADRYRRASPTCATARDTA